VAHADQAIGGNLEPKSSTSHRRPPKRWRVVDRLGEQIILELLRDSRAGIPQRELAERYGISVSSVKRFVAIAKNAP